MIFEASEFVFKPASVVSRARRILIKPSSSYPLAYPVTTSHEMLAALIAGIRQISDADIIILDGTPDGEPIQPIYKTLEYDFPRVLTLDVRDCILVEVDNPLSKPFIIPTFWVPNVILSSDYLITVTPLKIINQRSNLTIANLLTLLPSSKYSGDGRYGWGTLYDLGIDKVLADLYFTLPFDMGIVEARRKFTSDGDPTHGNVEDYQKIFTGEPYEVDRQVVETLGLNARYLDLVKSAKAELET